MNINLCVTLTYLIFIPYMYKPTWNKLKEKKTLPSTSLSPLRPMVTANNLLHVGLSSNKNNFIRLLRGNLERTDIKKVKIALNIENAVQSMHSM